MHSNRIINPAQCSKCFHSSSAKPWSHRSHASCTSGCLLAADGPFPAAQPAAAFCARSLLKCARLLDSFLLEILLELIPLLLAGKLAPAFEGLLPPFATQKSMFRATFLLYFVSPDSSIIAPEPLTTISKI